MEEGDLWGGEVEIKNKNKTWIEGKGIKKIKKKKKEKKKKLKNANGGFSTGWSSIKAMNRKERSNFMTDLGIIW